MAAKPEDYRVSELLKKGSKAIDKTRDEKTGSIMVRKKDGKQTPVGLSKKDSIEFTERIKKGKSINHISKEKPFVKYGMKPIRDIKPGDPAKSKSDWIDTDEFDSINEEQTKFSGETSGYVEKPKYNEEELQKALDTKVDELIKKQKPEKPAYVKKTKFDDKQKELNTQVGKTESLREKYNIELAKNESLKSEVATLEVLLDSGELQRAAAEDETEVANDRFVKLLSNFQQSLIKGTKEGIERVSLTAQVRGLQAQKVTLKELLEVQKGIVANLESQVSGNAAEAASAASGLTPAPGNEVYFAVVSDADSGEDNGAKWTTSYKSSKSGKAGTVKVKNLRDDAKKITKIILKETTKGGISQSILGFGNDSALKPSVNVNIEQGQEYSEPFYFNKKIGGGKPAPKPNKNFLSGGAKDYSGKFKIEIEFEDGTGNVKVENLTWKIRKNKKG